MNCNLNYRISTTGAGLAKGNFFLLNIPPPDNVEYRDHSVEVDVGLGGMVLHGYRNVRFLWTNLRPNQTHRIKNLVDEALSAGTDLYLTFDRDNGDAPGRDWIDTSGTPHPMIIDRVPSVAGSRRSAHVNVELFVNNLSIVNDPSTVV